MKDIYRAITLAAAVQSGSLQIVRLFLFKGTNIKSVIEVINKRYIEIIFIAMQSHKV